jgi:putative hemolysin
LTVEKSTKLLPADPRLAELFCRAGFLSRSVTFLTRLEISMTDFVVSAAIWVPGVIVMVTLILFSGFFSASETALFFLSRDEIRSFAKGTPNQRMVASLMASPDRVLTAILFWNLLINLACFSVGLVTMHKLSHGGFTRVAAFLALLILPV